MHCYARFMAVEIHTTHIETYVVPLELLGGQGKMDPGDMSPVKQRRHTMKKREENTEKGKIKHSRKKENHDHQLVVECMWRSTSTHAQQSKFKNWENCDQMLMEMWVFSIPVPQIESSTTWSHWKHIIKSWPLLNLGSVQIAAALLCHGS